MNKYLACLVFPVLAHFPVSGWAQSCENLRSRLGTMLDFGDVQIGSRFVDREGEIRFRCSEATPDSPQGVPYILRIDDGQNGNFQERQLRNAHFFIPYNIYRTPAERAAGTPIWGDDSVGSNTVVVRGFCTGECIIKVYSRGFVGAGRGIRAGNYTDFTQVTLDYGQ